MNPDLDLNLLRAFDALVEAGSVTGAADRLQLSIPATSRALGRLRKAMGDPIFVRSGRGLAPTPFAIRAAPRVRALLEALLIDERSFQPSHLERTFTIRINDAVAATLATALMRSVSAEAAGVELLSSAKEPKTSKPCATRVSTSTSAGSTTRHPPTC